MATHFEYLQSCHLMVLFVFGNFILPQYITAIGNFYVAQAPFTNAWGGENYVQQDGFSALGNPISAAIGAEPRFLPGQWSQCSTTCGPGVSTRTVECVAVQGITSDIIKLPDYECEGTPKPSAFQPCQVQQCPLEEAVEDPPVRERSLTLPRDFKWDYGHWTACSASCLGGKQRSTLRCIDVKRQTAVAWSFCDAKQRPVNLTRSCNNDPCPPEWDIGEMSQCSHTCGGGLRTRKVRCIRRISRTGGAESTLILPDGQCPQPKPINSEACGLVDCPVMWKVNDWSQCSTSCNIGEQYRKVTCEQRVASGEVKHFNPPIQCQHIKKPPTVQLCNLGKCNNTNKSNSNELRPTIPRTVQHNLRNRKLTLNIGGSAKLFLGTSLKVKCPVRNYAKNKIIWTKNGRKLINNAHVKVSTNGALRIFHARKEDAGVYTCIADGVQGNVTLTFKPRDVDEEPKNDSRSMLDQNLQENAADNDFVTADHQLIQKMRQSLKKSGDIQLFDRLAEASGMINIKVDYAAGEWSKCSEWKCGKSTGVQVRQLKCQINYDGFMGYVDDEICQSFNVVKPSSSRSCVPSHCPRWETTKWSECSFSRCIRHFTSIQKRDVKCAYENGTVAALELCDRESRPKIKKECVNVNCTAEWRPSLWGQCSRTCGDGGVQMRLLRCIWRGTRKPAGRNCQSSLRPAAIRECQKVHNLPTCPTKPSTGAAATVSLVPQPLFKGWENWRGWRLYNWQTDDDGNLRRKRC